MNCTKQYPLKSSIFIRLTKAMAIWKEEIII